MAPPGFVLLNIRTIGITLFMKIEWRYLPLNYFQAFIDFAAWIFSAFRIHFKQLSNCRWRYLTDIKKFPACI
jgi:hypothetical protein